MKTLLSKKIILIISLAALVPGLLIYIGYRYWDLNQTNSFLREKITELKQSLTTVNENLAQVKKENTDLAEALLNEQNKNQLFENQIKGISGVVGELSGTVGVLKKLSQTDPELLKKYSRVYFLSEHYTPSRLEVIDAKYLHDEDKPQQFHTSALPFLIRMLDVASSSGVTLQVVSAYRSFGTQAAVKSGYKVTFGAGTANQFSADQGYSEHQLGTAVDLTSPEGKDTFFGFEKTKGYKWLLENAYKFGFILSYPQNNTYYQFEPWHWRFVGVELSTKLQSENKRFYDLPQREIDEYLVNIFD